MSGREVTTKVERCHKMWLSGVLDIPPQNYGIDLIGDRTGIELKSRYRKYPPNFAVHNYQVAEFPRYNPGKKLYWAFLLYDLKKDLNEIYDLDELEEFVSSREVWFFEWNWIKQFPISSTRKSSYRYVNTSKFPPKNSFHRFKRNGGVLYVPPNTSLEKILII